MSIAKRKIWLHYDDRCNHGPKRVIENLLAGLRAIPDKAEVVDRPGQADLVGVLQHPGMLIDKLPVKSLMGPNIFVLPFEATNICSRFKNFVVPSVWVKNKYEKFPDMKDKNIEIWPVGIDTQKWLVNTNEKPDLDCFIYEKNRGDLQLGSVELLLKKRKLSYKILRYGSYQEDELKALCYRSKFAVLLTNTESQGIAYMNILSTNTPCYVFDQTTWLYEKDMSIHAPATSVPYFDSRCGVTVEDRPYYGPINEESFDTFLDNVKDGVTYSPRKYIKENHSLKASATKYLELLEKAHG